AGRAWAERTASRVREARLASRSPAGPRRSNRLIGRQGVVLEGRGPRDSSLLRATFLHRRWRARLPAQTVDRTESSYREKGIRGGVRNLWHERGTSGAVRMAAPQKGWDSDVFLPDSRTGVHPDRASCRDCYHRDTCGDPLPGLCTGAREGAPGDVSLQTQAVRAGRDDVLPGL